MEWDAWAGEKGRFFWGGRKRGVPASEGGCHKSRSSPRRLGDLKVAATRDLEDRAGVGHVGVEFVDEVGILLLDNAAL
jgi:hypothetical protein